MQRACEFVGRQAAGLLLSGQMAAVFTYDIFVSPECVGSLLTADPKDPGMCSWPGVSRTEWSFFLV